VREAPRALIRRAGFEFRPAASEEVCCGFGGTYSGKFPEISAQLLSLKLDGVAQTGADLLLTECPGCILQLRGGAEKRGDPFRVLHLAEALAARLDASGETDP